MLQSIEVRKKESNSTWTFLIYFYYFSTKRSKLYLSLKIILFIKESSNEIIFFIEMSKENIKKVCSIYLVLGQKISLLVFTLLTIVMTIDNMMCSMKISKYIYYDVNNKSRHSKVYKNRVEHNSKI